MRSRIDDAIYVVIRLILDFPLDRGHGISNALEAVVRKFDKLLGWH